MKNRLKNKKISELALLVALIGGLLFFPVEMKDGYTCLFHRLFNYDDPVKVNKHNHETTTDAMQQEDSAMLSFYLHRYAFIWWASIALAVLSGYSIWKLKNRLILTHTEQHGGTH